MINTDCSTCPFADKCYMRNKFQRHPRSEGGLGLCPKVEIGWASATCRTCHFTGRVGSRDGAKIRTCKLLPNEPIVQNIKRRKKKCPFMEQVIKERALGVEYVQNVLRASNSQLAVAEPEKPNRRKKICEPNPHEGGTK